MKNYIKKAVSSLLSLTLLVTSFSVSAENVTADGTSSVVVAEKVSNQEPHEGFGSRFLKKAKEIVKSTEFLVPAAILTIPAALVTTYIIRANAELSKSHPTDGGRYARIGKYGAIKITLGNNPEPYIHFNDFARMERERIFSMEEREACIRKVNEILSKMNAHNFKDDFDKAQFLHDYICNKCKYHRESIGTSHHNNAYACLIQNSARCNGISEAFSTLCNAAGIECGVIYGKAGTEGGGHAWNTVKINGEWCYVDVTWDLPSPTHVMWHEYFIITEQVMLKDHTPDPKTND